MSLENGQEQNQHFFPSGLFLRVSGKQWQRLCVMVSVEADTQLLPLPDGSDINVIALCSFVACHYHLGTSDL